ncbi:ABC transporter ATP-binding protein [Mesorhizobium sp. KR9-304]|uniref:ABC transporter ATP-binding protein n=1 Tax=Mesorhizobium sp. KR9-304 TaxID=3156614 RepID=UPI0032B4F213
MLISEGRERVPMLFAERLAVAFRDADGHSFNVLDAVDFAPAPGRLTAVTGASGSGKSTLLNALSGLVRLDSGRIMFDGTDVSKLSESRRDRWRRDNIGLVFQNFYLIDELSPSGNVMVAAWFDRLSAAKLRGRADALLKELGVPGNRKNLHGLSRGEQQRIAIARALMFDPPIILADEPTASLDRASGRAVAALLGDLARRDGRTVVVVTHDLDLIAAADTIVELAHGRLATPQAVMA